MLLSILIPAVPSRIASRLLPLLEKLEAQAIGVGGGVEILTLLDNKRRSVGMKRQALLDIARGDYVAYVDDDDDVSDDYLIYLAAACRRGKDVVTFKQRAVINGAEGHCHFSIHHKTDEPWTAGQTVKRRPWHVCAWRREMAVQGKFLDCNYGEDAAWVDQVAPIARSETHVDRVLHLYRHDTEISEALP